MGDQLIWYSESGSGPLLILVHGWGMDHTVWDRCIPLLSTRYRLLAVDLRGHGASGQLGAGTLADHTNDLQSLLQYLGAERAVIVGWSLGAQVALSLAIEHPSQVSGLALIGATPQFVQSAAFPHGLSLAALVGMQKKVSVSPSRSMAGFHGLLFSEHERSLNDYPLVCDLMRQVAVPSAPVLLAGLTQLHEVSLLGVLSAVQCPVTLIHGSEDQVCPVEAGWALADCLTGSVRVELPDAGHAPLLTMPKRVVEGIQQLCERIGEW